MGTRIRGDVTISVDYWVEDDLTDLQAEEAFNQAALDIINNGWDYGSADYNQDHEFDVEED